MTTNHRPRSLADALIRAMQQPTTFQAQAEEARRFVGERYDWDDLAERLESIWFATVDGKATERSAAAAELERQ